jgi:glycosyltransferase involved in cell wall biosynthesis
MIQHSGGTIPWMGKVEFVWSKIESDTEVKAEESKPRRNFRGEAKKLLNGMKKMKFSIIAIAYNNPALVVLLMRSLRLIKFPRSSYEIILVDDGSTSKINEDVNFSNELDHYIYLPRCNISSRARARNSGAVVAKGEFLIFIDSDCLVHENFLHDYEGTFIRRPYLSAALGGLKYVHIDSFPHDLTKEVVENMALDDQYHRDDYRYRLLKINGGSFEDIPANWLLFLSGNFCIRRNIFFDVGQFDERFIAWGSEDTELGYRLSKAQYKYDLTYNKVFHIYDYHADGKSMDRYLSWVQNVGLFYQLHKDPAILLMMLQEKMIFERFCLGESWQTEFQITSFQSLKARIGLLARNPQG